MPPESDTLHNHLRITAGELCRFLGDRLPGIGGDDWWHTHVISQLSYSQQGQARARVINDLGGLDLAAMLRVFERNWAELSHVAHLPAEVRTHAREIANIRHACAHAAADGGMFSARDGYRNLDTLERFLRAIGTDPSVMRLLEQDLAAAAEGMVSCSSRVGFKPTARFSMIRAPEKPFEVLDGDMQPPNTEWVGLPSRSIGPFTLQGPGEPVATEIASFAGKPVAATTNPWLVTGPCGIEFIVHVVLVDDDAPGTEFGQVFCESRLDSPQIWDDVVKRLRIGIRRLEDGMLTMDLRAAHRAPGGRASRNVVPFDELHRITGLDTKATLLALGATAVGTRQELYGEDNKWRNWPAVNFEADDLVTPAVSWVVTTLMPTIEVK